MELFFFILLLALLLIFGYVQLQKGSFRTPGKLTSNDEEDAGIL